MIDKESDQNERRGFFRIDDQIKLEYEIVSDDEYNNATQILNEVHDSSFALSANFATLNHDNSYLLNNIRRGTPEIAQYLDLLNQKIDALSQHLLENEISLSEEGLTTANISASGIAFKTPENLKKNQAIKTKIVLMPEKIGIQAYGRIIDCRPDTENNNYIASMNFEHIRNDDKELMIKHNLNKQMIELRKRSESKEN
ncbi:MAG: PilZ domain-containing protein [Gammaproteobacteria bacterium]|nr:PilZ domain-containing protein [Gammaproteobacteria bacterium]